MPEGSSLASLRRRVGTDTLVAAGFLALLSLVALAAPLVSPYPPSATLDIVNLRAQGPTFAHPFGTDLASRDLLSRVIYGARTSLAVALLAVLLSTTLGTAYGMVAGYAGGIIDTVLMRALDGLMAIPRILLLIVLLSYWEKGATAVILGIGFTGWFTIARLVRAEVLAAKPRDYVSAAIALGAARRRIVLRHILPNVIGPATVAATVAVAHVIALEAGLAFLGFGAPTAHASWGAIILDGYGAFAQFWWIPLFPGLAILATALAFNVVGDGLRDVIAGRR
ncbi:MAG TPA: ABC transporter permease [Gemmatimonadaceae bacterium]|nr:ABC transporter permease [Gemmatimonadaceae bacterium]